MPKKQALKSFSFSHKHPLPSPKKKLPNVLYGGRIEALWALYEHLLYSTPLSPCSQGSNPSSTPYEGWVCFWFSPLLQEDFLGFSRFSSFSKSNTSKFPFDVECTGTFNRVRRFVGKQITSYNYRIK